MISQCGLGKLMGRNTERINEDRNPQAAQFQLRKTISVHRRQSQRKMPSIAELWM